MMADPVGRAAPGTVERIMVPFQGEGAGVDELSWGQRELWGAMRHKRHWMPIGAAAPLPPGATVASAMADLRFLMDRYPTLRTRLRLGPGRAEQVVAATGEVPLEIVDTAPGQDPAGVAERILTRYSRTGYDFVTEWPIRMAVVRHRGVPTHRVWVMCHLVTDAIGAGIMLAELADQRGCADPSPMPPLAQVAWQRSPAGQRQSARVLRHWERQLRTIPARRFPDPADHPHPRYWNGTFTSTAVPLALRAIGARTGATSTTALLAAFAVALAAVTGADPVVTRVVVNNRFRPGLARTVSPIVHNGLCVLDVAGRDFDAVLAQTRRRAITAYKHAYYDPRRLQELLALVDRDRGEQVDLGCFFNDRRPARTEPAGPPPGPPATPRRLRAAAAGSVLRWRERQDELPYDPLFVTIDESSPASAADEPAVVMSLFIDTHRISPADVADCVRGMEATLMAAARA